MYKRLTQEELKHFKSPFIVNEERLIEAVGMLKYNNYKVGLCCGTFDLLHPGHIIHLNSANKLCDRLIVGVASDMQVRRRKGYGRPIFQQELRMYQIANLNIYPLVTLNEYQTAVYLINKIEPDIYIKGIEYKTKTTHGITSEKEAIKSVGGEIKYTNDPVLSSSKVLNCIYKDMINNKALSGI